jgi:hypothetical protein
MIPMRASHLVLATFLSVSLGIAGAWAQPQGAPGPGMDQGMDQGMEQLHRALRLSGSQEDAWRAFQQAYAMDQQEMERQRSAARRMAQMTAPQRVDMALEMQRADLAAQQRRGAALKTFYATLNPQQQQIFDRETLPPDDGGQ